MLQELLEKAVSAYQKENWEEASHWIEKILKENPSLNELLPLKRTNYIKLAQKYSGFQAIEYYEKALQVQLPSALTPTPPDDALLNNLAILYSHEGQLTQSVQLIEKAIQKNPLVAEYHNNLGSLLKDLGKIKESLQAFDRAIQIKSDYWEAYDNKLLTSHYLPKTDDELKSEHLHWGKIRMSHVSKVIKTHKRARSPKINIGYVSADFRKHSCAYFLETLLRDFDTEKFNIFLYANNITEDSTTERFKSYPVNYRPIHALSDQQAAEIITQDNIHILMDTAGHTTGNRLGVFSLKPAPIQMTYLGYPNITGLPTIDYALTDHEEVPKTNLNEAEQKIELHPSFLCFTPPEDFLPINATPALTKGFITFGSFNHLAKISDETWALWIRLLKNFPTSHLFLKNKSFRDESCREKTLQIFISQGISKSRLRFEGWTAERKSHLELYHEIDIALDTFPYNGTTTTCEALWMGVPVITMAGESHVSRVTAHILKNIGKTEWIAHSPDEYLELISRYLKSERPMILPVILPVILNEERQKLRQILQDSPLMNGKSFCRHLENIFQKTLEKVDF